MTQKFSLPRGWTTRTTVVATLALLAAATATALIDDNPVHATPQAADAPAVPAAAGALPGSFAQIIEKVGPAVVSIRVTQAPRAAGAAAQGHPPFAGPEGMEEFLKRFFGNDRSRRNRSRPESGDPRSGHLPRRPMEGAGSGFIVDPDGYIVTNNHVVRDAGRIEVKTQDGGVFDAKLVGRDAPTDLAVLKVDAGKKLPYVAFSTAKAPKVGDWVITIGNPFGLGHTVTAGIVSAHHRSIGQGPYDDFIQIDAAINRGNSGGPAFDTKGRVIGVNTAIFSPTGGSVGIGFAIPAATARKVVAELRANGKVARGWLGVGIQAVNADLADSLGLDTPHGAIVTKVMADGPAAAAGLKRGDVILAVDGEAVKALRDLPRVIALIKAGREARLTVLRNGKRRTLTATIASRSKPADITSAPMDKPRLLGMRLSRLDPASRRHYGIGEDVRGVVVTAVAPGSRADAKGIAAGDVIVEVGNESVSSPDEVLAGIDHARTQERKAVLMLMARKSGQRFVALPLRKA